MTSVLPYHKKSCSLTKRHKQIVAFWHYVLFFFCEITWLMRNWLMQLAYPVPVVQHDVLMQLFWILLVPDKNKWFWFKAHTPSLKLQRKCEHGFFSVFSALLSLYCTAGLCRDVSMQCVICGVVTSMLYHSLTSGLVIWSAVSFFWWVSNCQGLLQWLCV